MKLKGGNLATNKIMLGDVSDEDIGAINYANNGNTMTFDVNAATRLTIESDGDVKVHERLGIGVTPSYKFHVSANSTTLAMFDGGNQNNWVAIDSDNGKSAGVKYLNAGAAKWFVGHYLSLIHI